MLAVCSLTPRVAGPGCVWQGGPTPTWHEAQAGFSTCRLGAAAPLALWPGLATALQGCGWRFAGQQCASGAKLSLAITVHCAVRLSAA